MEKSARRWTLAVSFMSATLVLASSLLAQPPGRRGNSSGPPGGGAVTLYADAHFRGTTQTFDQDVPNMKHSAFGNDRASSIVVAPGCQATLFSDSNYRGRSAVVEGQVSALNSTPLGNDALSSMRISCYDGGYGNPPGYGKPPGYGGGGSQRSGVTLYSGVNFSGRHETFYQDDSRLYNNHVGDNRARSVKVAPGCRATLYDVPDYGGRSVVVDRDIYDLGSTRLGNDLVSSIRVDCSSSGGPGYGGGGPSPGGPGYGNPPGYGGGGPPGSNRRGVTLYSDDRFRGASETFYGDVNNLKRSAFGNDRASSIRVDPGCRAVLYSDSDFRGHVSVVDYDLGSLSQTEVGNDSVSSIQVDCRRRR